MYTYALPLTTCQHHRKKDLEGVCTTKMGVLSAETLGHSLPLKYFFNTYMTNWVSLAMSVDMTPTDF
jgi:hypothetical protein